MDEDRQQRHTLALRDVAYVIRADAVLAPHTPDDPAKYRDQFRRRVVKGGCHHMPYLGCREFSAFFGPADKGESSIDVSQDLGRMLFDIEYEEGGSGRGKPLFFDAKLECGVLRVPDKPG